MGGRARSLSVVAVVAVCAVAASSTPASAEGGRRPGRTPSGSTRLHGAVRTDVARAAAGRDRVALSVALAPGADEAAVAAVARREGGTLRKSLPALRAISVEVPAAAATRVAAALAGRPDVTRVEPVRARRLFDVPDDPTPQPYLAEVSAPAAWDVTHGSADVTVAVVDSGVNTAHPDLAGKVAGTYNAVDGTSAVPDAENHGTLVAGVVAAATDNATGVAGAGWDTRVLAVKIDDEEGAVLTDAIADGIVWAVDHGADVLNLSFGSEQSDALEQQAITYALDHGVAVVASAGNDGVFTQNYPAAYYGVVAVGATDGTSRASFSNYGSWVDLGAPGVGIVSTAANGAYETVAGTSFSAPLVAAELALLRAVNPTTSALQLTQAAAAATTGSYGFAKGRVDFRAAFEHVKPSTVPTLVQPADGATVSGDMTVVATSTAERVRFTVHAGPTVTADVVDGVATATLPVWGFVDPREVGAFDCRAHACGDGDFATVSFENTAPAITSPAPDTVVDKGTFVATATAPGGGVRFYIDSAVAGFDAEAPYAATISSSAFAEGAHTLTAVPCDASGTWCDVAKKSPAVPIVIAALHPAVTKVAPSPFSPNGDGRLDTATMTYTLDVAQDVVVRVTDNVGNVVRGPGSLGTKAAGTHTWVWNGRKADGTYVADGQYWISVLTSKEGAHGPITGEAHGGVVVDRVAPVLTTVTGHNTTFYPVKDGYKDTFVPTVTFVGGPARLFLYVLNSAGQRVRTVDAGVFAGGKQSVTWDGRTSSGALAPAGTYRYQFAARDGAQNIRTTGLHTVVVSHKKLAARTATRVVTPMATLRDNMIGECSRAVTPARSDWTGSIGYYSNYDCEDPFSDTADFVATGHSLTLPSAVKYGAVRVAATGERAVSGYADRGFLLYLDKLGNAPGTGADLGSAYGTYWGTNVPAVSYLSGRTVRWVAGSMAGHFYRIRSFTVRWTYYVLV